MKNTLTYKIIYPASVLLLALAALALYRLGQMLLQPVNLFHLAHGVWVCLLAAWAITAIFTGIRDRAAATDTGAATTNRLEFFLLTGVALLTFTGFLLAGQGRLLAGRQTASLLPFPADSSMLIQSLTASALVTGCLFIVHGLLRRFVPHRNATVFPFAAMLSALGLILLFRLGPDIAALRHKPGFVFLFWSQFRSFIISLAVFGATLLLLTPDRLKSLTDKRYIYALACIVLITITALFGTQMHGRRLSLNLGVMNFQSVELVKLLALLFMVGYFRFEGRFLETGRNRFGLPRGRYLLPYLFMWALVLLPIFLQRDLGPTMLIFSLFLVIFYLGTGSAASVVSGMVLALAAGTVAYFTGIPSMVRTRVDMWLDPFHYSQNIAQSLWAAASGGLFGAGSGMGYAHRIPVVQSDFNFAVIAEEWGLIGVVAVLLLFGGLVHGCLRVAGKQERPDFQLLAAGLGSLWMLQTLVIVAGNMALLPLTGITLPFISYGGSSLLMNFVMLALLLRLSEQQPAAVEDIREQPTRVAP